MYLILMMGANFEAGRITSEANVGRWHIEEVRPRLPGRPLTSALPTFGVQPKAPQLVRRITEAYLRSTFCSHNKWPRVTRGHLCPRNKSTQVLRLRKSLNFKGLADQTCRHSRTTTQKIESILISSGVPPEFMMFSFAIAFVWNPLKLFISLSQASSDDQERMLLRST